MVMVDAFKAVPYSFSALRKTFGRLHVRCDVCRRFALPQPGRNELPGGRPSASEALLVRTINPLPREARSSFIVVLDLPNGAEADGEPPHDLFGRFVIALALIRDLAQ